MLVRKTALLILALSVLCGSVKAQSTTCNPSDIYIRGWGNWSGCAKPQSTTFVANDYLPLWGKWSGSRSDTRTQVGNVFEGMYDGGAQQYGFILSDAGYNKVKLLKGAQYATDNFIALCTAYNGNRADSRTTVDENPNCTNMEAGYLGARRIGWIIKFGSAYIEKVQSYRRLCAGWNPSRSDTRTLADIDRNYCRFESGYGYIQQLGYIWVAPWLAPPPDLPPRRSSNYFYLIDGKHKKAIVAGDNYDGRIYHQDPNGRSNAKWKSTELYKQELVYKSDANKPVVRYFSYYLSDGKHGISIVAGDNYDGRIYHQWPLGRPNAEWIFSPIIGKKNVFHIYDLRHRKFIVSGDNYDGNIYHQDHNNRLNAEWTLVPANPSDAGFAPSSLQPGRLRQ